MAIEWWLAQRPAIYYKEKGKAHIVKALEF